MEAFSAAPDILTTIAGLSSAAWSYAGLSAAFELGVIRALDAPASAAELAERLDLEQAMVADLLGVLIPLGAVKKSGDRYSLTPEFEPFRSGSMAKVLRAGLRSDQLQTAETFRRARDGSLEPGWSHRDPELLLAQGETAGLFRLAAEHILPSLPGLRERLDTPGARFLDVGAGVGVLSTELCLVYPEVSASCLEPNATARGIGRERSIEAGLNGRVEYLAHGIEELDTVGTYDLALIPQPFLAPEAFDCGLDRVLSALRPGGWLLVLALDIPDSEPLAAASHRFRARLWGGGAVKPDDLLGSLEGAGFSEARAHPPIGAYRMFAARRPVDVGAEVPVVGVQAV